MLTRLLLLCAAVVLATTSAASAAGKPPKPPKTPKPPKIPAGPVLTAVPTAALPGAPLTIAGARFQPNRKTPVELDCPMFGQTKHGQAKWTPRTTKGGAFTIKTHVFKPKGVKQSVCHIYALNVTPKGAYYVSIEFQIR